MTSKGLPRKYDFPLRNMCLKKGVMAVEISRKKKHNFFCRIKLIKQVKVLKCTSI